MIAICGPVAACKLRSARLVTSTAPPFMRIPGGGTADGR